MLINNPRWWRNK